VVAQEWTETAVMRGFLEQSPQARELRARVAISRAEVKGRSLYANPSVSYSHERAGFTEFFQVEQALPITGRLGLLKQAGSVAVSAVQSETSAELWELQSDLRLAFYRLLASQERGALVAGGIKELEEIVRILEVREKEGEGSRFDHLRMERELLDTRAEHRLAEARTAEDRSRLSLFLPSGTEVRTVKGQFDQTFRMLRLEDLQRRALTARADFRAEQQRLEWFRWEQKAAERLRFPEPVFSAGLKRAEIGPNKNALGPVIGITVPLPLFNRGRTEVARLIAEQDRVTARRALLAQQIRAAVEGAYNSFQIRQRALVEFQREAGRIGLDLVRIARIGYQEGELGILELLDAYRTSRQSQLRILELQAAVKEAQIELDRVVGEEVLP
jgi:cobalt-zinc-cadmium efflux system outer membrane protein